MLLSRAVEIVVDVETARDFMVRIRSSPEQEPGPRLAVSTSAEGPHRRLPGSPGSSTLHSQSRIARPCIPTPKAWGDELRFPGPSWKYNLEIALLDGLTSLASKDLYGRSPHLAQELSGQDISGGFSLPCAQRTSQNYYRCIWDHRPSLVAR